MDFTIVLIVGLISGLLFHYLFTKWILVPFYHNLNERLDYTVYYEKLNSPFTSKGYSVKGHALNVIISFPITILFISTIITIVDQHTFNEFLMVFLILICVISFVLLPAVGQYFRSDIFTTETKDFEKNNSKSKRNKAKDESNINKKYYVGYSYWSSLIPVIGFVILGILGLINGQMISILLIVIGLILMILTWFPDKIDEYWPWNLKTVDGVRYFIYLELFLAFIVLFAFPNVNIPFNH